MKNLFLLICLMVLTSMNIQSQSKLTENFNYPAGDSINLHGWTAIPGVFTNRMLVTVPGLSYAGYPLTSIGNSVFLTTSGQDAYKDMSVTATSQAVYASFMVNVSSAQRAGDYFAALLPSTSTTFFSGRVHARFKDGFLEFGLTKASPNDTNTMNWISGFSLNTTYLIVLKYKFIPGASNDEVSLFIFQNGIPISEPLPSIGPVTFSGTSSDAANIGRFALRQGTASRAPGLTLDGILVSDSWFTAADFYQLNASFGGNQDINSDWGMLKLSFAGYSGFRYLNLSVNAAGLTTQWQIQNIVLFSFYGPGERETQSFLFDIGSKGINVENLDYGITITDYPLMLPPPINVFGAGVADQNFYIISGGMDSNFVVGTPDVKDAVPLKTDPVNEIDTTTHTIDSLNWFPNQESDPGECVPTSISNVLKYLRRKHGLKFDSLYAGIDSLKKAVKFGEDFPGGTSMMKWPEYKKDYVDKNGLPITTRVIDSADVVGFLDSLANEIDNNQGIEAGIVGYIDGTMFDHEINIVATKKMNNQETQINILTDVDQTGPGGTINTPHVYNKDSNKITSGILAGFTINKIVIECPSPPKPVPVLPENESSDNSIFPYFDWEIDPPNPLHKYRLQIGLDPLFSLSVYDSTGIAGTGLNLPPGILSPQSLYFWRVRGLDSVGPGPWSDTWSFSTAGTQLTLTLNAYIEGFYNPFNDTQIPDVVNVELRNIFPPFAMVDQASGTLGDNGSVTLSLLNAVNNVPYYIVLKHRNSVQTWSNSGQSFIGNNLNYDFTSSAIQAYGLNLKLVNMIPLRFAIYSGDVNQDEIVDASDLSAVENDAADGITGYVNTDLTGDDFVDSSDLSIVENNAANSVEVVKP